MLGNNFRQEDSLRQFLRALFSPAIFLWIIVAGLVDKYLLGGRFEKKASDKLREQFAKEIQERVPCLFADFGAQIKPNAEEYPPAFDYAAVTVAIDGMLLLFSRCRGDFKVEVTPPEKPTEWRELSSVVRNSDVSGTPDRKVNYYGLNDFDRFFQANFDIIRREVSKPDWRPPARWLVPIS
jgi:hypothetical protein